MEREKKKNSSTMLIRIKTIWLFFFCYCHISSCSSIFAQKDELSVLLLMKSGLVDPLDSLGDWKLPMPSNGSAHCGWAGVSCNSDGAVTHLDLSRKNLSGRISDEIQQLRSLESLNLCCNEFASPLPKSLSNLSSLKSIDLSQNYFTGKFPLWVGSLEEKLVFLNASSNSFSGLIPEDLGSVSSLEVLDIRGNFFEGSIPKSFRGLRNLSFLGLSGNNLTGEIPGELGRLSFLETMIIGYNDFDGGIPPEFGNLTKLKYLDLSFGKLGGAIPPELGKVQELETIFLYKNKLEGSIPPEIGNITSLRFLDLSDNNLSGELPSEMGELRSLQLLNLMCNNFSGTVPRSIGDLKELEVLGLWSNSFSGPLPRHLGKSSPLTLLDVSSNSFSGEIPETLCSSGNLTKLIFFNNSFSGRIPSELANCESLVRVRMQNNLLSGPIPVGFGKLPTLQRLELANNSLTGKIPHDLSLSTSLSFIDLSDNRLYSSLPSTILSMPNLHTFIASWNGLTGKIPDQFQDCHSLSILDLSSNFLAGAIPSSIGSCEKLISVTLRDNQLSGGIPESMAMMPMLAILDLSNNSLTGPIPENFGTSPALEVLNVSYNRLTGPVPTNGALKTINPDDLKGNSGLCGGVLAPCNQFSLADSDQRSKSGKHMISGWLIGISSVLAVGLAAIAARWGYRRWYTGGSCFEERFGKSRNGEWPWRLKAFQRLGFGVEDILACVKESNMIGMGATGIVYRAEIPRLSTVVAVKKLWRPGTDIEMGSTTGDFVGEVNLLGKLRHRHIVRLVGYLHNDRNMMIVYEFMHNGNLGDALHGKQAPRLLVDWVSRYNVAVGVAHGLCYLHHDCHPPVIHRDIKSSNILLDTNLEARIADFGLAKMMVRKNETVSVVAGSYGYIAPEYGYTLKVDEKIDIYSYGVVLLELLTGRRPLDPEFGDSVDIVEWIRIKIRENRPLEEALDPTVGNCKHVQEEMLLVLRIAVLCTAKLPRDRPSMRDVITMLGEAKPRRKSGSNHVEESPHVMSSSKDVPVFSASPVHGLL